MKEGCEKFGCRVILRAQAAYRENNYEECDIGVCFGLHPPGHILQREFREHGTPLLIIDYGYLKRGTLMYSKVDEGRYYSLSLNGLNGRSDRLPSPMPPARWNSLKVPLQPWRTDGKYILVCGQKANDVAIGNLNPIHWAKSTIDKIQSLTSRPVMFRPHPEDPTQKRPIGVPHAEHKTFNEALQEAYCVVAYNSNSLVEATVAGVPTFTLGEGSMVQGVTNTNLALIDNPNLPDREQWAYDLAWRQYTIGEIRDGLLWEYAVEGKIHPVQKAAIDYRKEEPISAPQEFFEKLTPSVSTHPPARRGRPKKITEQPLPSEII
jgi:hypothetical protein